MNKKFLSAILFGALMVSSTGTFVSCKDYDDDIDRIDKELSDLASQLTALQSTVNNGDYVTGVTKTADGKGMTFTFSKGSPVTVTLDVKDGVDGKPGTPGEPGKNAQQVTISDQGELMIDGVGTGIKAGKAEAGKPSVKIEGGNWWLMNEKGVYEDTKIPASGLSAVQNADKSWTLTVIAADGSQKVVDVPSAASLLTDLIVTDGKAELEYYKYAYAYKLHPSASDYSLIKRTDWKGPRALPVQDGKIVAAMTTIPAQINPTTIDAREVEFKLVDTQNNYPFEVRLSAKEDRSLVNVPNPRASYGNGRYQMVMEDVYFSNDNDWYLQAFEAQFKMNNGADRRAYALTAGGDVRSLPVVGVKTASTGKKLTQVLIKSGNTTVYPAASVTENFAKENGSKNAPAYTGINMGEWYSVVAIDTAALYDMYLSVNSDYVTLYGVELKNERGNWQFRITRTPDNITRATFPLAVEAVDKEGTYSKTTIWVNQSDILAKGYVYDAINYQLKETSYKKNRFNINLGEMKTDLGADDLALWNTKVDLSQTYVTIVDPVTGAYKNGLINTEIDGITPIITEKNEDDQSHTAEVGKSNFIQFRINNAQAGTTKWVLGRQYEAYVTFKTKAGAELTTVKVPFTLTIPAITSVFQLDPNFVVNNEAVCYMYAEDLNATKVGKAAFKLNRVFTKFSDNSYTLTLDNKTKVGETGRTSAKLAKVGDSNEVVTTAATYITLADKDETTSLVNPTTGLQAGYGQSLKLSISGNFAGTWSYGDETFDFAVKVLSPIYEGGVQPKSGSAVQIPATKLDGYKFGNNDIIGNTYNKAITYNVLPDKTGTDAQPLDWKRIEIADVIAKSSNENVFKLDGAASNGWAKPEKAVTDKDKDGNEYTVNGYFTLKAQNVPTTTSTNSISVIVTDIWGYKKSSAINVTITVE